MTRFRAFTVLAAALSLALCVPAHAAPLKSKPKHHKSSPSGLKAPGVTAPANAATTDAVPVLAWKLVRGAVKYQVQIAVDKGFNPAVLDTFTLNQKFIAPKSAANGLYYWRVRAWNADNKSGAWSSIRTYTKKWAARSTLQSPANLAAISYPSPVILRWSPVPGASQYLVSLASGSSLAGGAVDTQSGILSALDIVWKDGDKPVGTFNTNMAVTIPLQPGTYYWQITPVDAEGHQGAPSPISTFTWDWPSTTTLHFEDISAKPQIVDPRLSWDAIPGAGSYEVEINITSQFVPGSRIFNTTTTASTISPTGLLPDNRYYWRVRALDTQGRAGVWNVGSIFDKSFDDLPTTITNLKIYDAIHGNSTALPNGGTAAYPVISWDPVPGAQFYEVDISCVRASDGLVYERQYIGVIGNAWTPYSETGSPLPRRIDGSGVYSHEAYFFGLPADTCQAAVRAYSPDSSEGTVYTNYTPTTTFHVDVTGGDLDDASTPTGLSLMSNADVRQPTLGSVQGKAPLFCWKTVFTGAPVKRAEAYYVAISSDAAFTNLIEKGYTNEPCFAPRRTYRDEETVLYWEVIPVPAGTLNHRELSYGFGERTGTPLVQPPLNPPTFNEHSTPPTQIAPAAGQVVTGNVTFQWSDAPVEYSSYAIQIARDSSFSDVIETVGTQSASYTSTTAYPPDTVLYWRVRVNNGEGIPLRWSDPMTFVQTRATPVITTPEPFDGETFAAIQWTPVPGAIAYETQDIWPDASVHGFGPFLSTAVSYVRMTGVGRGSTKVRAIFPNGIKGPYSPARSVVHTIGEPTGANVNTKHGMAFSWQTKANTKEYKIQVATDVDFTQSVIDDTTQQTTYTPTLDQDGFKNGGRLYWRVAAIDPDGNLGGFTPAKRITLSQRMDVKLDGSLAKGGTSTVTVTVTDAKGKPVRKAEVKVSGAGATAKRKRTNAKGVVVLKVHVRKSGKVSVKASKAGFRVGTLTIDVA